MAELELQTSWMGDELPSGELARLRELQAQALGNIGLHHMPVGFEEDAAAQLRAAVGFADDDMSGARVRPGSLPQNGWEL